MRTNVHSKRGVPTSQWDFVGHESDGGERHVNVKAELYGDTVYVTLTGDVTALARGTMVEDRVLAVGPGERLYERLVRAEVRSLLGDVVGSDRTRIGAAEDYASKVLRAELDRAARM